MAIENQESGALLQIKEYSFLFGLAFLACLKLLRQMAHLKK